MGFIDSVKSAFLKCFDYQSRSSRSEFWWFYAFTLLTYFFDAIIRTVSGESIGYLIISIIISIGIFVPYISLTIRRFHDINLSGWWYLFYCVLPLAIILIAFVSSLYLMFLLLIMFIYFVYLMAKKGTEGPNEFGNDPLSDVSPKEDSPFPR